MYIEEEVKIMQNTATVEKSKVDSSKREEDFLSELIPIQLDWSLEERIKIAEMSLNPRRESRELKVSESARKAIRKRLEYLSRTRSS